MVQKVLTGLAGALLGMSLLVAPASAQSDGPSDGPSDAPPGLTPPPGCAAPFPPYDPDPVATGQTMLVDQEITMSDGVVLRADVSLPTGIDGPFPATITITGYNKSAAGAVFAGGDGLTAHGYASVLVDDRGTGTSGGEWDSWGERTQADYEEVLDWVTEQSWSNGEVALTGGSYMGITALFAAASGHPAVKAVFATVPMGDAYRDIVFGGGQINTAFIPLWMGLVTGLSAIPSTDPSTVVDHILGITDFQLPTVAGALAGGGPAYDGPFWRQRSPLEVVDDIDVPVFVVGGLDDIFQRGEPMLYEALVDHTDARLLVGPWTHGNLGAGLPGGGVPSFGQLTLQWLDAHVKGLDSGVDCIPQVTQYVRGIDRWASAPSWPIPGLEPQRWYMRGPGSLSLTAPTAAEAERQYLQLPTNGICTRSTNQWLIGLLAASPCVDDNRLDESLALTWTSEPFAEDVRIDGPIQADLWVTTLLGGDALTSVAVSLVHPDGRSEGITNGQLLASHRAVDEARARTLGGQSIQPWHPFTEAAVLPVTAGEPMHLPVEVFPTSLVVPAGYRLRVTVAAYDIPHAMPPVPAALAVTLGGPVAVLSTPEHPSSIVFPVVAASAGAPTPVPDPGPAAPGDAGVESLPATGRSAPVVPVLALLLVLVAVRSAGRWSVRRSG